MPNTSDLQVPNRDSNVLILAISGSLRASSSNKAVLEAVRELAVDAVSICIYQKLGSLPHFNPDLDGDNLPDRARASRSHRRGGCGRDLKPRICARVPGTLKNLLDWLVASTEFPGKPVALINTSPRAIHSDAALREILTTMSAKLIPEVCVTVPISANQIVEGRWR
jgi:chromate reductase, NAD(P)H dehydrogenase (quinone)